MPTAAEHLQQLEHWFLDQGWTPWPYQQEAWRAQLAGESGLIHVPTGAGKTYAAYIGALAELAAETPAPKGLRILYVTPLRAVTRDVEKALRRPIEDLGLDVSIETRTGDTSSATRARQRTRLPNVLLTTPESLNLLMCRDNAAELLGGVRQIILDEWHELLASKRGTQTELACARVRCFSSGVRTWALSATLSNVDDAARTAVGVGSAYRVVQADIERPVKISTLIPDPPELIPWAGHMGLKLLPTVLGALDPEVSTLIFCNTRNQAEMWHHAIQQAKPEWDEILELHHGSIDRAKRERVESGLKDGSVRLVVATSSLDLGVDFSPVERVIQIGSPKGIARLLQRAGRASHRPGAACEIKCVPTFALQLIEIEAVREAAERGEIEPRECESKPLDVLAQHMVTCALGGGFRPRELLAEVRATAAFEGLTEEELDWTLRLVEQGGGTLSAYPEFCKVVKGEDGVCRVTEKRIATLHRMNVGTITGSTTLSIQYVGGRRLGSIEENFIAGLREGQKFVFAGKVLKYVRVHQNTALVRRATGTTRNSPHWAGTRLPITESMASCVRRVLENAGGGDVSSTELEAASGLIRAQWSLSRVPKADELLAEVTETREGRHLFLYPFEGRLVNAGLAAILALRLTRMRDATFSLAVNDYGLELLSEDGFAFEEFLTEQNQPVLFSSDSLLDDTIESVNMGELSKRQFREVARVAGLVFESFPGGHKSGRQLGANSGLIYDVLKDFDPEHLLLKQAEREVLERQFEKGRLTRLMDRLRSSKLVVVRPDRPTPLGFPLIVERVGGQMSSESIAERVERMQAGWKQHAEKQIPEPPAR